MNTELNPERVKCLVFNKEGKKVGSIMATDPRASQYIQELMSAYGGGYVEYEEVSSEIASIQRLFR